MTKYIKLFVLVSLFIIPFISNAEEDVTPKFFIKTISPTDEYSVEPSGALSVPMDTIKIKALNKNLKLNRIDIKVSTSSGENIYSFGLFKGNEPNWDIVGLAIVSGRVATLKLFSPILLAKNETLTLKTRAGLDVIGSGKAGTPNNLSSIESVVARGIDPVSKVAVKSDPVPAGMTEFRMFKSIPKVEIDYLPRTGLANGRLLRFKVSAHSSGSIGLGKLKFAVATSGVSVSDLKVNVYSDSEYTIPVIGTFGDTLGQFGQTSVLNSSSTVEFLATTSPLQIPRWTTYYFELNSTVSDLEIGAKATTTLLVDESYGGFDDFLDVTGNFIWSGNNIATSTFADPDWSNSYGLKTFEKVIRKTRSK